MKAVRAPPTSDTGDVAVAPPSVLTARTSPALLPARRKSFCGLAGSTAIRLMLYVFAGRLALRSCSVQWPPPSVDCATLGVNAVPLVSVNVSVCGAERATSTPVTWSPAAAE